MVYRSNLGVLGASFQPTVQPFPFPASVGGINAIDGLMGMNITDCIYTFNLMPVEYGLQLRQGYYEWAVNIGGASAEDVRTVVPYSGLTSSAVSDKVFAVSTSGIYDVTTFGTDNPTKLVTFGTINDESGYGVSTNFNNDASEHYLFYADRANGVYQYTVSGGWAVPTGWQYDLGAGNVAFPVADVRFIMVHKQRVWVFLKDSEDAWYLPVASISGILVKFTFGSKLVKGGALAGMFNWTVDGGIGVDDHLVVVSRAGDVAVWKGSDPTAADWDMVGIWFIGELPASYKLGLNSGGALYLLSSFGIVDCADLLQGVDVGGSNSGPSSRINRFLRADIKAGIASHEWAIETHPADGFLQVITPEPVNTPYLQYTQDLTTKAWGFWEDVPALCGVSAGGEYYMGSVDGKVYVYGGIADGTTVSGTIGTEINFRTLTAFTGTDTQGTNKKVGMVKTHEISVGGDGAFNATAVYDYNIEARINAPIFVDDAGSGVWDSSVWNVGTWSYGTEAKSTLRGSTGMGNVFAIALAGSARNRLNIVGWDVMFQRGGLL
tara:strand:+ start:1652 stop:3298 length:1647 start_codon:yes stop_codon:yes gene_type:complete